MSFPWRSSVVPSCVEKKTVRRSLNEICARSNSILITSACPLLPEQTSSYVTLMPSRGGCPPVYPGITEITPFSASNTASVHQKHPPPKTAIWLFVFMVLLDLSQALIV